MTTHTEILVLGGGAIGLAIALELQLKGQSVTVLNRSFSESAGLAAAGMLAPQAEGIEPGPLLDLCLRSRALYADWTRKLEDLTGLETGYWPCGILTPVYEAPAATTEHWLHRAELDRLQPGLGPDVVGGWWYPEDAQVDNRALMQGLRLACQDQGVQLYEGVTVQALAQDGDRITGVQTSAGEWQATHYILATGAWAASLLPHPVAPRKGQMLSLQVPPEFGLTQPLRQVLFGDVYVVPRRDGRIVIGATSEAVGFLPNNTPAGIQGLLARAIRVFPSLQDFPIQELWWGFRPETPDQAPILGPGPFDNLTLALGHYRNGILLMPITAQLISNLIVNQQADPLLDAFHYSRLAGQ